MLCFGVGLGPMSARKFSNEVRQRSQTLMPRPPYPLKSLDAGRVQRSFIAFHAAYSRDFLPLRAHPCRSLLGTHPQPVDLPVCSVSSRTGLSFPQSQRHSQ